MTFQTDGKKGASQSVRVHLPPRTLQVQLKLLICMKDMSVQPHSSANLTDCMDRGLLYQDCQASAQLSYARAHAVPAQSPTIKQSSVQVLTGKARYSFSHAIHLADLEDERRVSITFRQSPLTRDA